MTQEDKELLWKDLCARLPYEVKVKFYDHWVDEYEIIPLTAKLLSDTVYIGDIKPYLFPLSSMTEEQQEEFDRIYADDMQVVAYNLKNRLDGKPYETNLGHYRHFDWLNKNHFDYRGLIPKGLALDATGKNIY